MWNKKLAFVLSNFCWFKIWVLKKLFNVFILDLGRELSSSYRAVIDLVELVKNLFWDLLNLFALDIH